MPCPTHCLIFLAPTHIGHTAPIRNLLEVLCAPSMALESSATRTGWKPYEKTSELAFCPDPFVFLLSGFLQILFAHTLGGSPQGLLVFLGSSAV